MKRIICLMIAAIPGDNASIITYQNYSDDKQEES